jgi:mutator protein MutT
MDERVGTKKDPLQKAKGIIMHPDGILLMHRIRKDAQGGEIQYYVFPGGGREIGETVEQCLQREIFEEAGVHVKVGREFARLKFEVKEEYYILCEYQSGVVGSGEGPEYSEEWIKQRGLYIAEVVPLFKVPQIDLKPYAIKRKLVEHLVKEGKIDAAGKP